MSKRKVQFAEDRNEEILAQAYEEAEASGRSRGGEGTKERRFKEKHSLDSDEEDEPEDRDLLHEDDIDGQEDTGVDIEEGVRFTPFNMREEMEEGHFDTEGMYIFKRNKGQIHDSWIDDVDWVKVKQAEKKGHGTGGGGAAAESDEGGPEMELDETQIYRDMLGVMQPGETVLRAIKRLGGHGGGLAPKGGRGRGGGAAAGDAKAVERRQQQMNAKRKRAEQLAAALAAENKRKREEEEEEMVASKRHCAEKEAESSKEVEGGENKAADQGARTEGSETIVANSEERMDEVSESPVDKETSEEDKSTDDGSNKGSRLKSAKEDAATLLVDPVKQDLLRLVGLADKLLSGGNMEIYEYTYEKLKFKVDSNGLSPVSAARSAVAVAMVAKDSGMDMFADDDTTVTGGGAGGMSAADRNKNVLLPEASSSVGNSSSGAGTPRGSDSGGEAAPALMWEYKWEDSEGAEVHGPFSSAEMLEWTEGGYFPNGVFVRKVAGSGAGEGAKFYSSRRIDFELYV